MWLCWLPILLVASFSCTHWLEPDTPLAPVELTEREKLFNEAEKLYLQKDDESAFQIYARLTRNSEKSFDPVYDNSLWRMVKIYEHQGESEKALLTLDELSQRPALSLEKNKIKFAQIKNHYLISNSYQAEEIKKELDQAFKVRALDIPQIAVYLRETADLNFDLKIFEELQYLGAVQKYFLFVIESNQAPQNEMLSDFLIHNYQGFFQVLSRDTAPEELKSKMTISLLAQLTDFKRYTLIDSSQSAPLKNFINYAEKQQKTLQERLTQ